MDTSLKIYLKDKKLSIKKFSKIIKYSQCHTSQVVNGKKNPSFSLAKRIELATGGIIKRTVWYPNE